MNGYIALWRSKKLEVYASTSYEAQTKATVEFQKNAGRSKVKSYYVTVMLAEKNGEQVVHTPNF